MSHVTATYMFAVREVKRWYDHDKGSKDDGAVDLRQCEQVSLSLVPRLRTLFGWRRRHQCASQNKPGDKDSVYRVHGNVTDKIDPCTVVLQSLNLVLLTLKQEGRLGDRFAAGLAFHII